MKADSSSPKNRLRFALFLTLAVGIFVTDIKTESLNYVRSTVFSIAKPLIALAELPANIVIGLRVLLADREVIMQRNREISEENVALRRRLIELERSEQHAKWLGDLLNASEDIDQPVLLGSLRAIEPGARDQRVIINRGTDDGIFVGQAVLDFRGILGQVDKVAKTDSAVVLITDSNHSIPVRVRRTNQLALANGLGVSNVMSVPYMAGKPDIEVGDVLVSSGLGGRFPANYPVAEIVSVNFSAGDPFAEIIAEPFATIDYGYDVLLVMRSDPLQQSQNQTVSMHETESK